MSRSRLDRMSSHICNGAKIQPSSVSEDMKPNFREIRIPVPWGHIAAKEWGNGESGSARRVLGLHGWQDNGGTFDPLVPHLMPDLDLHFVSVDLPGHGLSSHRPLGTLYSLLDYVGDVKRVVRHLNWETNFSFLSHSMGSAVAMSYAACYPDEVDRLVLLDLVKPMTRSCKYLPSRMASTVNRMLEYEERESLPPRDVDVQQAVDLIVDSMAGSVSESGALVLLERGSRPSSQGGQKIVFNRDQRLKLESVPGVTREQMMAVARGVRADMLIVLASEGLVKAGIHLEEEVDEFLQIYRDNCRSLRVVHVDGTHHVHLNRPERVALHLRQFFGAP